MLNVSEGCEGSLKELDKYRQQVTFNPNTMLRADNFRMRYPLSRLLNLSIQ